MSPTTQLATWRASTFVLALALAASVLGMHAQAAQPNMQAALEHLEQAKAFLQKAEHDKGGWRARAVGLVDQAIVATRRGMSFADQH